MKTYHLKLLAILPALILGWLVWRYGVNLPFWDEWDTPGLAIVQSARNEMTWRHWMGQHNESRTLFPRLLFVSLASLTNWNIKYEMLVTFLLACSISFSVYHLSKTTLNSSPRKRITCLILANLLIFSPMQWENWLWGLQASTFIPIASITASLAIIFSQNPLLVKFLCSAVLATIATFSFANGMLCWIIIFPSLIWVASKSKRKVSWVIAGWLFLFSLNLAVYFYDYHKPGDHPSFLEALVHPVKTVAYFLSFLGSPLGFHDLFSNQIIGLVVLVLFSWSCFYFLGIKRNRKLLDRALPWLSIGGYTIVSGILTTSGRVGSGVEQSLASRYITFSTYGMVALIYLLVLIAKNLKDREIFGQFATKAIQRIIVFTTVAFLFVYPSNFILGVNRIVSIHKDRLYGKACLILLNVIDDEECINNYIYPDTNLLRQRANDIDKLGFLQPNIALSANLQDMSRQDLSIQEYGSFDNLSRDDNENYTASGWSVLPKYDRPAHAVILAYQTKDNIDRAFALVKPEKKRKDLVEALNKRQYLQSGWSKSFAPDLIPTDAVAISAWSYDSTIGRAYKLNLVHQIER